MIHTPLDDYNGTPVEPDALSMFQQAFTTFTTYRPTALWELPDGRHLAELEAIDTPTRRMQLSSDTFGGLFSELMLWEAQFKDGVAVRPENHDAAWVIGALMRPDGAWKFYVVLTHITHKGDQNE